MLGATVSVALTACASTNAPNYTPSVDNLQTLHSAGSLETRIRTFDSRPGQDNPYPVPLRAARMRSPVGDSFGAYLSNAMEQEFLISGAISPEAKVEVSGTLLKNDVDASGLSRGDATISARFIVRRGDQVIYDSVKTASGDWKSSFAGAVAIGNAIEAYPHIVARLLAQLYADPVFVKSIH
ncbi:hypothetical protein AB4851_12555 [Burkholderia sp. 22PA0099]|uniref:hypothetical protein n=1 Tax=Burkholderia sp. 22PA0099 TaxID=3237372 RepID=UPI0039C16394